MSITLADIKQIARSQFLKGAVTGAMIMADSSVKGDDVEPELLRVFEQQWHALIGEAYTAMQANDDKPPAG